MGRDQKQVICVLGMHRSGTSLLAGCLNILGLTLGRRENLMSPGADNPTGFWEHRGIVTVHDHLLADLGLNWHDPSPLPERWTRLPAVAAHRNALRRLCLEEFGGSRIWAFKDPRVCRLLPLWHALFTELGVTPGFLIAVRNPLEVAESLARRNGFKRPKSLLLWLWHNLAAREHTSGYDRVVVEYASLLHHPRSELERIKYGLRLPNLRESGDIDKDLAALLKPELRHQHAANGGDLPETMAQTHALLAEAANGNARALPLLRSRIASIRSDALRQMATLAQTPAPDTSFLPERGIYRFRWPPGATARLKPEND